MARESRGLGRGLQALLSAQMRAPPAALDPHGAPAADGPGLAGATALPLSAIRGGMAQPRKSIARQPLEDLAASIRSNGVIQPIVVRPLPGSGPPLYEIVAGERRWQAAKLAGLTDIPAVVRTLSDREAVAVALIENIQREELTPAEEARTLQRLVGEFALTHLEVAEAVGRSRAAVSNLLRLLDLPAAVVELIDAKALSMGHARALLGLAGDAERLRVAHRVVERGLSVRATEGLVRQAGNAVGPAPRGPRAAGGARPELAVMSEVMRTSALTVQLEQKSSGAARIVIDVTDAALRDALLAAIRTLGAAEPVEQTVEQSSRRNK